MSKIVLGDICEFINGGAWSDKEYVSYGIPVLKVTNCKPQGFQIDDINYLVFEAESKYNKNRLFLDDVIIATVGSHPSMVDSAAGRTCVVTSLVEGFYLNQNAVCLRTKDQNFLDQRYLGYLCKSRDFQHYIQNKGRGAANQMRIAIGSIKEYYFELPPLTIQKKIADILSAYDDLIENNQKQIKLLEEATQRLYKEWFVDLRFPGYETTPIIDGIPQGWKRLSAESFFNITIGKTPPRTESQCFTDMYKGIPWISISDMGESSTFIFETSEGLTNEAVEKYNVKIIPAGTILLSFKLTVGRVAIATANMCTNEAIAHFKLSNEQHREYVYCYLKNYHYDSLGSTSSISKAVNSKIIKAMPFVLPENDLIEKFSKITAPLFNQIFIKLKAILELKQARDRLLIKLMSGEIDVSQKRTKEMLSDKFDEIRKHWQKVRYNEELPLAARRTGDISEETLEKLKNIAEEE